MKTYITETPYWNSKRKDAGYIVRVIQAESPEEVQNIITEDTPPEEIIEDSIITEILPGKKIKFYYAE